MPTDYPTANIGSHVVRYVGKVCVDHFIPHDGNNHTPHVLKHSALLGYSLILILVKALAIVVPIALPSASLYSSAITATNIVSLTNVARANAGLGALTMNALLGQAAQAKADDMLAKQYFAHQSPDGRWPWDFIRSQGYTYVHAGENLAVHFQQAEDVQAGWMASPTHRANVLKSDYREIGVGVSSGQFEGVPTIFVAQMFGTRPEQLATAQPAPAPEPAPTPNPQPPAPNPPAPQSLDEGGNVQSATEPAPTPQPAPAPEPVKPAPAPKPSPEPQKPAPAAPSEASAKEAPAPAPQPVQQAPKPVSPPTAPAVEVPVAPEETPQTDAAPTSTPDVQIASNVRINADSARIVPTENGYSVTVEAPDASNVTLTLNGVTAALEKGTEGDTWSGNLTYGKDEPHPEGGPLYAIAAGPDGSVTSTILAIVSPAATPQELYVFGQALDTHAPVKLFGLFEVRGFEDGVKRFYAYAIVFLAVVLLVNILVKFHIQKVGVIAHAMGVLVLAVLLSVL